jgi:hypothetical protein
LRKLPTRSPRRAPRAASSNGADWSTAVSIR